MVKDLKIAFSGRRGVGKTSAAKYLVSKYGFRMESFAGKLKFLASKIYPFNDLHLNGNLKEEKFEEYDWTPRDFMIKFGSFMRYWDSNYWIRNVHTDKPPVVIDDLRYLNEIKYLKERGFIIIRINRFEKDIPYKGELNDSSETELDNYEFDYIIHDIQNTSLTTLHSNLDHLINRINSNG